MQGSAAPFCAFLAQLESGSFIWNGIIKWVESSGGCVCMFILCGLPKILSAVNAWRCQDSSYFSKIFFFLTALLSRKAHFFFPLSLLRVGGQREQSKDDPAAIDPMLPAWALSNSLEG